MHDTSVSDQAEALRGAIDRVGYYPTVVAEAVEAAVAGEAVTSFVIHHEPTFDQDEVRRHVTVLVLTPSRMIVAHTDEHPPDDLLPQPYASTTDRGRSGRPGRQRVGDPDGRQPGVGRHVRRRRP